jgi:SAM-dependent methyltransferase
MGAWNIETTASEAEIRSILKEFSPWRTKVTFNGSISSDEYETFEPFSKIPLNKINAAERYLPKKALSGRILDVGCNSGYNSIALAQRYRARPTGIDFNSRHPKVADRLAKLANVDAEFLEADAEQFSRPGEFDLIIHFGTLYHLPNPLCALYRCGENLKSGGWLALETTAYTGGDDPRQSLWVWGFNGDKTNYWALSKLTIEEYLDAIGFHEIGLAIESRPAIYEGRMSRVLYVARKA